MIISKRWLLALVAVLVAGAALVIVPTHIASTSPVSMAAQSANAISKVNTIRVSFQRQSGGPTSAYSTEVLTGIRSNNDPPFAPFGSHIDAQYSLWGIVPGWSSSSLQVVNDWVYHDGWLGSMKRTLNGDCTSASASGCNGHRRAVLSSPPMSGATLRIDIETRQVKYQGSKYLAVAALLVWSKPTSSASNVAYNQRTLG
ncbi:MAG TPA: hypothetical protein VIJ40_09955 [Acidimicrobiales bacterium]